MPFVPGVHVSKLPDRKQRREWPGTSPAMTVVTLDFHLDSCRLKRPADRYWRDRLTENSPSRMRGARFSA